MTRAGPLLARQLCSTESKRVRRNVARISHGKQLQPTVLRVVSIRTRCVRTYLVCTKEASGRKSKRVAPAGVLVSCSAAGEIKAVYSCVLLLLCLVIYAKVYLGGGSAE